MNSKANHTEPIVPDKIPVLRRVYWETTAACNLKCIHCRRIDVWDQVSPDELSADQSKSFINDLAEMGKPVLIFSGGEPLLRNDIFEIASYAKSKGLMTALATNGTLVTKDIAQKVKDSGIYYAAISLDGATPETHDIFRGPGNFSEALNGLSHLQELGIKVQVNFTVTRQNVNELPKIYDLVSRLNIHALFLFLLVAVGCGVKIADSQMLNSQEVEEWLKWVCKIQKQNPGREIRVICAPQFYRVQRQINQQTLGDKVDSQNDRRMGCLAGINICFVSHLGDVYPCGYLPISAGNVRITPLSTIWKESHLFQRLRDENILEGKCGLCEFKRICGGCRARAYYAYGTELGEEPYCFYEPPSVIEKDIKV